MLGVILVLADHGFWKIRKNDRIGIIGANGSGKSTLSNVLAGNEEYNITSGEIKFKDKNIFDLNIVP